MSGFCSTDRGPSLEKPEWAWARGQGVVRKWLEAVYKLPLPPGWTGSQRRVGAGVKREEETAKGQRDPKDWQAHCKPPLGGVSTGKSVHMEQKGSVPGPGLQDTLTSTTQEESQWKKHRPIRGPEVRLQLVREAPSGSGVPP